MRVESLTPGATFQLTGLEHLGVFTLLHLSPTGATVQSSLRQSRQFKTARGDEVMFDAPARPELIGGSTLVKEVKQ